MFAVVAVTDPVLDAAARLAATHGLRAYDAVRLACALAAREAEPACETMLAADIALHRAAAAEGFAIRP